MGLILGYSLHRGVNKLKITETTARLGWSIAIGMAVAAMFGMSHMARRGYEYNAWEAAVYNAFAPIVWCLFLVWCAVAGWNNRGGTNLQFIPK